MTIRKSATLLRPVTFWRRVLLGRIGVRQLARAEVPE
jgi:hypothetical protein